MNSQASSLRGTGHSYFAVYSSLIYFPRPVWRVLFHVCRSHDILQHDTTGQFGHRKWSHQLSRSFLATGWIFHQQNMSVSVRAGRTCNKHTRAPFTHQCASPSSQTTRILQISAQHSAAIIQTASTEDKGGFWTKPQLFSWQNHAVLTSPICFPVFVIQGWLKTLEEQKERMKMEVLQRKIGIPLLSWKKCVQGY